MRKVPGNALALQAIWVPQKTATRSWSGHLPRAVLHRRHGPVVRHDPRRLAGHPRHRQGRVVQANLLWDVREVMRQAGVWPLSPRWGWKGCGKARSSPMVSASRPPIVSQAARASNRRWRCTRRRHTGPRRAHRHAPARPWAPRDDGMRPRGHRHHPRARRVDGYQLPFRIAFHRPQGTFEEMTGERARHGAGHYIRIGDAPCSVTGG
jgi:hypothetical protein